MLVGNLVELADLLVSSGDGTLHFDAVIGRNALASQPLADREQIAARLAELLCTGGTISLCETVPRHTQRLYALLDLSALGDDLAERVRLAEEAIYSDANAPLVNWDGADLLALMGRAGLQRVAVTAHNSTSQVHLGTSRLGDWFSTDEGRPRLSYAQHLLREISSAELSAVRSAFERALLNQTVPWRTQYVHLTAVSP